MNIDDVKISEIRYTLTREQRQLAAGALRFWMRMVGAEGFPDAEELIAVLTYGAEVSVTDEVES